MRRYTSVKIFMCIFPVLLFLHWYDAKQNILVKIGGTPSIVEVNNTQLMQKKQTNLKYMLQWTSPDNIPFMYMGVGQKRFIENKCKYTNCYVTSNRSYLESYTYFDVVVFAGPQLISMHPYSLPSERSPEQKYVFASIESPHYSPLCSNEFDEFFNWTWTYKLDSESRWGYLVIRDKNNNIIGPNKVMHWMKLEDMDPVSDNFKHNLTSKTKAAAWFVSNCFTMSRRELFGWSLKAALTRFKLTLDINGACGPLECSRHDEEKCENLIKTNYYFYLAFENSFGEDYVTEKLLHGLRNNAIPVVYGGANYTRFMPNSIYLNARQLGVNKLASKMNELIKDPDKYAEYFRWQNHYSYHRKKDDSETDDYCGMCSLMNSEAMKEKSMYSDFRKWWDEPDTDCDFK